MSTFDTDHDADHPDSPGPGAGEPDGVEIRTLHTADEMVALAEVFTQVWGSSKPLVTIEILMAISHAGGYVSAAYDSGAGDERMLGASVAILARHDDRPALHSHITGLLPGARRSGHGRAMTLPQRSRAAANVFDCITWTFDPLVRRNAWFNIAVLGVEVHEFLPSFYGTMHDSINAGGDSDRLLVAWPTASTESTETPVAEADTANALLIPTPEDIVLLRRTDPTAAATWRDTTCHALRDALDRGDRVIGFTAQGEYVVEPA